MKLSSVNVGYTDGIIKRQGVFPGVVSPPATPIQFITNIDGLSGEPDVRALNAAFNLDLDALKEARQLLTYLQMVKYFYHRYILVVYKFMKATVPQVRLL